MKAIINPSELKGSLDIIPSKSHAHRLLIAANLAGNPGCVNVELDSEDIIATKNALSSLFPQMKEDGEGAEKRKVNESLVLDCKESGSTLRFLLPVAKVLDDNVTFLRSGRLPDRPLFPLDREMRRHGCSFVTNENDGSLTVRGRLSGGKYTLPGNVSSQFITGLLLALPLTREGGTIKVENPIESKPYIEMTLSVLRTFGIAAGYIERENYATFSIEGRQKYRPSLRRHRKPLVLEPEGDWSGGAFWLAANALGSDIRINGLDEKSVQGDKEILNIISDMLDDSACDSDGVFTIDVSDIPDLVPVISILAFGLNRKIRIVNAGRLRTKESDRLAAICDNLNRLGCSAAAEDEEMKITPSGMNTNTQLVELDGYNDHRIVMALAITSCFLRHPISISGCEAVNKSYPGFFDEFSRLGGDVKIEE